MQWSRKAQAELKRAYEYIKSMSLQHAEKVKNDIVHHSESLAVNPERYPPDKFKIGNNGQYRFFVLYHYRISYKIMDDVVLIVRMRHTSMSPLAY